MRSKPAPQSRLGGIRGETAILMSLAAFVFGIVLGAALTVYKLEKPGSAPAATSPSSAPSGPSAPSPFQEAAQRSLEARVRSDPSDLEAWIQLGNLHFDLGQPVEAVEAYEKALALQPGNPDVLTDQGIMYRRMGQPDKAVERFREARRADPMHFRSLYNLGVVLLHDMNDVQGAIQAWEEYLKVAPQGPQADHIRDILQKLKADAKPQDSAAGSGR